MVQFFKREAFLVDLGLIPYELAWQKQQQLIQERLANPNLPDVLLLLEHPPVYTLGRGSSLDFLKFDPSETGWEVHRIERGGEVTYHCPGQLVVYPILNLHFYQTDLHWYLRQLEEVIIRVLGTFDLQGYRIAGLTGVWLEGHKVAAIGISVRRWLTMHGFSLNVCPDLTGFTHIIPCGINNKPVGNLVQFRQDLNLEQVREEVVRCFAEVFEVNLISIN
jgi:lipoyl(octanoyl) transferase